MFKPALIGLVMKIYCCFEVLTRVRGGVLPMMAYTGRLRMKGVSVLGFRYMKKYVFHLLNYIKG